MLAERIGAAELAELSAQGASLGGELDRADLPRIAELIARDAGAGGQPLQAEIGFRKGPQALPVLRIRVRGVLPLVCQRCLQPVSWPLDVDVTLTAVASEEEGGALEDPFDSVLLEPGGALALRAAVEDEILAVLPLSPRHAEGEPCGAAPGTGEPAVSRPIRPFAGLGALLGKPDPGDDDK